MSRVRSKVNWKRQGACLDVARVLELVSRFATSVVVGYGMASLMGEQNLETSRNVTTLQKEITLHLILRLREGMQTITLDVEASDTIDNGNAAGEVDALDSHEQGVGTSRAHSLEIEVCERNVLLKIPEKGEVNSLEEGHDVELKRTDLSELVVVMQLKLTS